MKSKANPKRRKIPSDLKLDVLTECGYRCAVPTCRSILALDLHHIVEVSEGGENKLSNLIALCPTDHALYHRGTISADSIFAYKSMLVTLANAFDLAAIDKLLFLAACNRDFLIVSGDGLLHFARLIAGGLAEVEQKRNNDWQIVTYAVNISQRGRLIVEAWKSGDRNLLERVIRTASSDRMEADG